MVNETAWKAPGGTAGHHFKGSSVGPPRICGRSRGGALPACLVGATLDPPVRPPRGGGGHHQQAATAACRAGSWARSSRWGRNIRLGPQLPPGPPRRAQRSPWRYDATSSESSTLYSAIVAEARAASASAYRAWRKGTPQPGHQRSRSRFGPTPATGLSANLRGAPRRTVPRAGAQKTQDGKSV